MRNIDSIKTAAELRAILGILVMSHNTEKAVEIWAPLNNSKTYLKCERVIYAPFYYNEHFVYYTRSNDKTGEVYYTKKYE